MAQQSGYVPWKYYPKHHLFVHFVEVGVASSGTPREIWCYPDESPIGDAVENAEPHHARFVVRCVIEKHRL